MSLLLRLESGLEDGGVFASAFVFCRFSLFTWSRGIRNSLYRRRGEGGWSASRNSPSFRLLEGRCKTVMCRVDDNEKSNSEPSTFIFKLYYLFFMLFLSDEARGINVLLSYPDFEYGIHRPLHHYTSTHSIKNSPTLLERGYWCRPSTRPPATPPKQPCPVSDSLTTIGDWVVYKESLSWITVQWSEWTLLR